MLGAAAPLTWNDILLRTLYYFGLLAGGGAAVFGLLTRSLLGEPLRKPLAHLLFFSLLLVFLGGSGIVHSAPPGTRYALVLKLAVIVALAGGAAAALAPAVCALLPIAGGVAAAPPRPHALRPCTRPQPAAASLGAGGLRAPRSSGGLARRPARPRLCRAAGDRRRTGSTRRRTPVLDDRPRRGARRRHHGNCAGARRALGCAPGLVDLVRAGADRQVCVLSPADRSRLAQPQLAPDRVRAPASIGARRAHGVRRHRDRGGRAHRAPPRTRRLTCDRCHLAPAACTATGPASAQRRGRGTRARRPRGRARTHARPRRRDAARPGRHGRLGPKRARRGRSGSRLWSRLLPRARTERTGARDRERPRAHILGAGARTGRDGTSAFRHEALPRCEDDRLRRVSRLLAVRRAADAVQRRGAQSSLLRDPRRTAGDRDRGAALGPRSRERAVAPVAADAARRHTALLADADQRSPGGAGRPHVPRPARPGLVPGDPGRAAALTHAHDGGGALHDRSLRRVQRAGRDSPPPSR